jgi:hypothetical protein
MCEEKRGRIKIVLGGDALVMKAGRISMAEFSRRVDRAANELHEINDALAGIGLRIGTGSAENPDPNLANRVVEHARDLAKPAIRIVHFSKPPPEEFRRKLVDELKLRYEPQDWSWYGSTDPRAVEDAIRSAGHWGLVRFFCKAPGVP